MLNTAIRCQLRDSVHIVVVLQMVLCVALVCLHGSQVKGEEKVAGGLQPSDCIARTMANLWLTVRLSTWSCAAARYGQFHVVPSTIYLTYRLALVVLDLAQRSHHWKIY
jgi:hypothetical protein